MHSDQANASENAFRDKKMNYPAFSYLTFIFI